MDTGETSIKIIPFNGEKKEWIAWKAKFLARAHRKGYEEVLTLEKKATSETASSRQEELKAKTEGDPEPVEVGSSSEKKEDQETKNLKAYDDLLLSMETATEKGRIAFNIVRRAKTRDGIGNANVAWSHLCDKYEPRTTPNRARLQKTFYSLKCKPYEDPELYVANMDDLRNQLEDAGGERINDSQFLTQILNSLPKYYENLVERLEERVGIKEKENVLTIEELTEKLSLKYTRMGNRNTESEREETALVTGQFKGTCNYCGKYGHKSVNCREKKHESNPKENAHGNRIRMNVQPNKAKPFQGKCFYCGLKGHKIADCYKRQRANKQLEVAATTMEHPTEEVALFMMEAGPNDKEKATVGNPEKREIADLTRRRMY